MKIILSTALILSSFLASAQTASWTNYNSTFQPDPSDTFLLLRTNGTRAMFQFNAQGMLDWVRTNTLAGVNTNGGLNGTNATISIGSTTTLPAGSSATVSNTGNSLNAIIQFGIPAGATGATGPTGPQGIQGIQGPAGPAGSNGTNGLNGINGTNGATGPQGIQGPAGANGTNGLNGINGTNGATGAQGPAGSNGTNGVSATITVGTVTTLAPGSSATVSNSGTASAAVFDIGIPRGDTGATGGGGSSSPAMLAGNYTSLSLAQNLYFTWPNSSATPTTAAYSIGHSFSQDVIFTNWVLSSYNVAGANIPSSTNMVITGYTNTGGASTFYATPFQITAQYNGSNIVDTNSQTQSFRLKAGCKFIFGMTNTAGTINSGANWTIQILFP